MSICSSFFCLLLQMNFLSSFMVFWAPGGWFDSANGGCWQKLEIGQRVMRVSLVLAHFLQSHRNWFVPLTLALPSSLLQMFIFSRFYDIYHSSHQTFANEGSISCEFPNSTYTFIQSLQYTLKFPSFNEPPQGSHHSALMAQSDNDDKKWLDFGYILTGSA